jgi:RNA polymerase sigma factor (sigma-70 family)
MHDQLGVPAEWPSIADSVSRFVAHYFRGRSEVDTEDVVQEVLLHLLRSIRTAQVEGDLTSFAQMVARRRCIDALRRSYVSRRYVDASGADPAGLPVASPETPADESHERQQVRELLLRVRSRLTPRCQVVLDQLLLGMRLAEVARVLGTSAGAVRNRWFHCRQQIRSVLHEWGLHTEDLVG